MSIARYELCSYFGPMYKLSSRMINVYHGLYHDPYPESLISKRKIYSVRVLKTFHEIFQRLDNLQRTEPGFPMQIK